MYEYLKGTLTQATPTKAIVDVSGIGFCVFISIRTFEKLPAIGKPCHLFTSVIYREDSQKIYGFLDAQERDLFHLLNDISGVGPRLSLSLLGHLSSEELFQCAQQGSVKVLSSVPGIGKKMAERLVIELKDKAKKFEGMSASSTPTPESGLSGDAISALMNLGYNGLDAQKRVNEILKNATKETSLSEVITLALKAKK